MSDKALLAIAICAVIGAACIATQSAWPMVALYLLLIWWEET